MFGAGFDMLNGGTATITWTGSVDGSIRGVARNDISVVGDLDSDRLFGGDGDIMAAAMGT
jgi:hypothetical protein